MSLPKPAWRTIGEVEKLTGIPRRTLKYYLERGLLVPTRKSSSGYWLYNDEDIRKLRLTFLCRELEVPDDRIRAMLVAPEIDWEEELNEQIERLKEKQSLTGDHIIAAEYMRYRSRRGDGELEFASALSGEAGVQAPGTEETLFAPDGSGRVRPQARQAVLEKLYRVLSAPEMKELVPQLCVPEQGHAADQLLRHLFQELADMQLEEALFAVRMAMGIGNMEAMLDRMLGQEGATHCLADVLQAACSEVKV